MYCIYNKGFQPLAAIDEYNFKQLFDPEKQICLDLQEQINQTDKSIDNMVYGLYELTEDEIKKIESNV